MRLSLLLSSYSLFIEYDKFLCFRCIAAVVGADVYTVEVESRVQAATTIGDEVPVEGIDLISRNTVFAIGPQVTTRGIEDVQLDIHLTACAVVDNAERGIGLGRIGRTFYADEMGFQSLHDIEV